MNSVELLVQPDGNIRCLYTDLIDLSALGTLHVNRASHVEFNDSDQTWSVRLADTGEVIGKGFKTRTEALEFEVNYLNNTLK